MSAVEDNANDVTQNPADQAGESSHPSPEPDKETTGGSILLFFMIGLAASMIIGWVIFPKVLYSKKAQPINFNHALHVAEVDDECQSCHFFREDGSFSGIPKNAQCIDCHEEVNGESEDEAIFVEEYIAKDREVPWLVYSRQPDCVFFSHSAHVNGGGMDCITCHGNIGESEIARDYEENRITGYSRDIWGKNIAGFKRNTWDRMKMDDCAECHATAEGHDSSVQTKKDACFVCHK